MCQGEKTNGKLNEIIESKILNFYGGIFMKKQLLSILTAAAMTLSAISSTVNAAELDDYVNSSNKELAEFFEVFAVNSEYQRDDGAVLTTDGKADNFVISKAHCINPTMQ